MTSHPQDESVPSPAGAAPSAVTVIVPTYGEADNLPHLIRRLDRLRDESSLPIELLVVDDNSRDGTMELIASLGLDWVRLEVRTGERGLSSAVMHGFGQARHDTVVVMDADLSHPPEKIPEMLRALEAGDEMAVGSRYVPGGSTDASWGLFRALNSRVATVLARPFTTLRDPMSGFFAVRRAPLDHAIRRRVLNPVGYKIALEVIVKCRFRRIAEIPIHFADRQRGQSKLTLKEQLRYLRHLRRLFAFKYSAWCHLANFIAVGLSGTVVNLSVLTVLWAFGVPVPAACGVAIGVSMMSNFAVNRRFTLGDEPRVPIGRQLARYMGACAAGAVANYLTTLGLYNALPERWQLPPAAALAGIAVGTVFNYVIDRYLVFRDAER